MQFISQSGHRVGYVDKPNRGNFQKFCSALSNAIPLLEIEFSGSPGKAKFTHNSIQHAIPQKIADIIRGKIKY